MFKQINSQSLIQQQSFIWYSTTLMYKTLVFNRPLWLLHVLIIWYSKHF